MVTRLLRVSIVGTSLVTALACGGLPFDPSELAMGDAEPEGTEAEPEEAEPEPLPAPEDLFAAVDGAEAALERAPRCPSGTTTVRHPRGGGTDVYCASSSGRKTGTWSRWRGRRLLEVRTYVDGVQDGPASTWDDGQKTGESVWVDGQLEGEMATWDEEGTLLVQGQHHAGERHGLFLEPLEGGTFTGACYQIGVELWRTDDPEAFVTDPCVDDTAGSDDLAALEPDVADAP